MFTYLDPKIRKRLTDQNKLIHISRKGETIARDTIAQNDFSIQLLGPIPLPIQIGGRHYHAKWYAAVRTTEITSVESLAKELTEGGKQNLFAKLADPMAVNSVLIYFLISLLGKSPSSLV